MQDWQECALKAFQTFVDRGREAINLLERSEIDEALKVLSKRNAALANFKVYDARSRSYSGDQLRSFSVLSQLAVQTNERIHELLVRRRSEETNHLLQVRDTRKKLSRYKSGQESHVLIERSV